MRPDNDAGQVLTRDDIMRRLDWASKNRCHKSGDTILAEFRGAGVEDAGVLGDVLQLLELLPADDPAFQD
ncbi:hypothetical protein DMA15_30180 [Streptomyces sp. WAC 01529]|nr:hypothetical protein DMA15_30180 [Streptomyces sp. WAC 01529]